MLSKPLAPSQAGLPKKVSFQEVPESPQRLRSSIGEHGKAGKAPPPLRVAVLSQKLLNKNYIRGSPVVTNPSNSKLIEIA